MDQQLRQLVREIESGDSYLIPSYAASLCRIHGHRWYDVEVHTPADQQGVVRHTLRFFEQFKVCLRCCQTEARHKQLPLIFYEAIPEYLSFSAGGRRKRHYAAYVYPSHQRRPRQRSAPRIYSDPGPCLFKLTSSCGAGAASHQPGKNG